MDLPSMWAGLSTPAMSSMVGARSMFSTGSARFEPAAKPGPLTKNGTLMSNWGEETESMARNLSHLIETCYLLQYAIL